jgi:hypothetical protein
VENLANDALGQNEEPISRSRLFSQVHALLREIAVVRAVSENNKQAIEKIVPHSEKLAAKLHKIDIEQVKLGALAKDIDGIREDVTRIQETLLGKIDAIDKEVRDLIAGQNQIKESRARESVFIEVVKKSVWALLAAATAYIAAMFKANG